MYSYKSLLLLIMTIFSCTSYSKKDPGGVEGTDVSSNLTLWLTIDRLCTSS